MRKAIVILILVLIAGGITYQLIANKKAIDKSKEMTPKEVVIPVHALTVKKKSLQNQLIKQGTLLPFQEADITTAGNGKLVSLNFEKGKLVRKGEILGEIDNDLLKLNLEAAKLTRDKARKDLERAQALLAGDATTQVNVQEIEYNYNNSLNQISQIEKQMADNRIKAPINGQIISKTKEAGEFITPGAVIGQIVNVNQMKADVLVSEQDVYSLSENDPVTLTTDVYPGVLFDGKIIFISESGDAVHNYEVEVALQNKKEYPLKAGSFVNVNFNRSSKEEQILIPKSALIQSLDKPMVYVLEDDQAREREIEVGSSFGDDIIVVSGLQEGEEVISGGLINLYDGAPVRNQIEQ